MRLLLESAAIRRRPKINEGRLIGWRRNVGMRSQEAEEERVLGMHGNLERRAACV